MPSKHARGEESSVGGRNGGGERGHAPEQRADAAYDRDAYGVQERAIGNWQAA